MSNQCARFLIYLLPLLLSVNVFATPQRSDYLMYQGEKYRLHTNPLEELFFVKKELGLKQKSDLVETGVDTIAHIFNK